VVALVVGLTVGLSLKLTLAAELGIAGLVAGLGRQGRTPQRIRLARWSDMIRPATLVAGLGIGIAVAAGLVAGDEVAVFKVAGRMFALVPLGQTPASVSLKCDPDLAVGLRGRYAGITPGYHLNKRHWNTLTLDGSVPDEEVLELLDHSYDLVVARLTKAQRDQLITLKGHPRLRAALTCR
jgi:predicted DNA-binding protein (MmcQ/YjbR family)